MMAGLNGAKPFDKKALLAEIEENEKKAPPLSTLPKLPKTKSSPRIEDTDEDLKGDNNFFSEKPEFENG